jgi:ABC-2 type transport system permease protein
MIDIFRAEFLKLRSTRTAIGLAVAVLVIAVLPAVFVIAITPKSVLDTEIIHSLGEGGASLVPIIVLVFGILGMTGEYRHGTITYTYLATPRRGRVIVVKLVVYGLVGAAAMLLALALVQLISVVGLPLRGLPYHFPDGAALIDYARQIGTAGLMTAFGVALGALFRNQVVTVAGVLIWALAVETVIFAVKEQVAIWLPFMVFNQVIGGPLGQGVGDTTGPGLSRPEAFLVSIGYIAALSVLAVFISMRRDVT